MLLEAKEIKVHFPIRRGVFAHTTGWIRAVDGVSLQLQPGQTLGLVGESGCGKSTIARAILRLQDITSGEINFEGNDITAMSGKELQSVRARMQVVFQDPFASLNPRMTIQEIITEGPRQHGIVNRNAAREYAAGLLEKTGLGSEVLDRYPHEFSGGQRQRICIARALSLNPRLIICDEAVSALDVSVQAQIINLLQDLQRDMQLAYLFIAHDISVVRHMAQRIAVMYLGRIIEEGPGENVISNPLHPYTRALMAAIPRPGQERHPVAPLHGEVPSATRIPSGCRFHPRCKYATDACRNTDPQLEQTSENYAHNVACLRWRDIDLHK